MDISVIFFLLLIPGFFILLWVLWGVVGRISPFPFPYFMGKYLDSSYRRAIQPHDKLISRSGIKEGMSVLEAGCGSGAFTNYIALAVGNKGKVYALDIQYEMLDQLRKKLMRFENRDIKNIELFNADLCNMPFEEDYFDVVCIVAVLQEIPEVNMALRDIKRVLKHGGILAVTEFALDPNYPLKSTTIKQCEDAGFIFDEIEGNFLNYTIRFIKPEFDFEKMGPSPNFV